ncbi:MAG: SMC-Scp complex subunit ScpB [Alphaproteobacteria bacterium]|nr:SMC-Scp complex subunit ScpB [Alphaproteobacteria bacterium]
MNNPNMAEEKIEEIVDQIAEEMQEEDSYDQEHEGESEAEEVMHDMADKMEQTQKRDMSDVDPLRMLEAMLFASSEPISPQAMLERLPESADLNVLLPQLQELYNGRGVELTQVDGKYALRTAADVGEALTVEKEVSKKMSKAALETMAIIAYHQPITRAEIENIRGVATHKGTLDILMEMGWVKPGRRRETPGRPLTWMTTTSFLDHFQLESIMDLPGLDDLKASGLLDRRAAIETIPDTQDLFENADIDAEEVLEGEARDLSDDDAYDEASYKEIQAERRNAANNVSLNSNEEGEEE